MAAVQPRKGLYRFDVIEHLIHIHRVKQGFVKTGLEHIRDNQDAVRVCLKDLWYLCIRESIHACRGQRRFLTVVLTLARESDNGFIGAVPFRKALVDGIVIFDASRNTGSHNHSAGLPANFSLSDNLFMKVVNHHSALLRYGIAVALHKIAEFLLGALFVKHRIVLDSLH